MVTSVSVKPSAVCSVSIVPTRAGSDSSAIDAENCAESATMVMPHTMQTATSAHGGPPNRSPTPAAQLPLTAPAAMVANAASLAYVGATAAGRLAAKLALRNTPTQAHIA